MEALGSLLVLLKDNPALSQGFIGGFVASVLFNLVAWRWTIRRRKHENGDKT